MEENGIIAHSHQLKKILDLVHVVADSPSTILITGESGTGKELIANMIHQNSSRKNQPFIKVNCAAIPETLLESEFFGYEKGAFTGAVTSKPGRFELAHKGTLFLDEIGELSREMQVKLLRVLQELEFERVGGLKTIKVDIRLVVATNLNLENAVENGKFRQDLYYRLNVVPIHLPPLRERPDDIPPLVNHFLRIFNERLNRKIQTVSEDALEALRAYPWPGNIRELENIMERTILLSTGNGLETENFTFLDNRKEGDTSPIPSGAIPDGSFREIMQQETERIESQLVISALKETNGNVTRAAKKMGLSRKGLQLKMKRYGIKSGEISK